MLPRVLFSTAGGGVSQETFDSPINEEDASPLGAEKEIRAAGAKSGNAYLVTRFQ